MGRWTTGAITTGQCLKLHVSLFAKELKKSMISLHGTTNWSNGAGIGFKLSKVDARYILELEYTKTFETEKNNIKYQIALVSIPSNLGKGKIYYFLCPFTFRPCRVLYMSGKPTLINPVCPRHRSPLATSIAFL
jgi:hypothetical protein